MPHAQEFAHTDWVDVQTASENLSATLGTTNRRRLFRNIRIAVDIRLNAYFFDRARPISPQEHKTQLEACLLQIERRDFPGYFADPRLSSLFTRARRRSSLEKYARAYIADRMGRSSTSSEEDSDSASDSENEKYSESEDSVTVATPEPLGLDSELEILESSLEPEEHSTSSEPSSDLTLREYSPGPKYFSPDPEPLNSIFSPLSPSPEPTDPVLDSTVDPVADFLATHCQPPMSHHAAEFSNLGITTQEHLIGVAAWPQGKFSQKLLRGQHAIPGVQFHAWTDLEEAAILYGLESLSKAMRA